MPTHKMVQQAELLKGFSQGPRSAAPMSQIYKVVIDVPLSPVMPFVSLTYTGHR